MRQEITESLKNGAATSLMSLLAERSRDMASQTRDSVIESIVKHPLRSVGISAAIGLATGYLMKRKRESPSEED